MPAFEFRAAAIDFTKRQIDPGAWFSVASSLRFASLVLFRELSPALKTWKKTGSINLADPLSLRLRGPYAMLAGMAIENMLKGLVVQRTPRSARRTLFPKKGKGPLAIHDLTRLAELAAVPVEPLELELLKRLTTFVVWAGRYPVPLDEAAAQDSPILKSDDFARIAAMIESMTTRHLKSKDSSLFLIGRLT